MSAATLSPQALAEACAKAMWDDDNATRHLGMELASIAPGEATIVMTVSEIMTNGHGTCHGGYMFTLADRPSPSPATLTTSAPSRSTVR